MVTRISSLGGGPLPVNHRKPTCRIENLLLPRLEPVSSEHLLRCPSGHACKYRPATRQLHPRRPREMENIVTGQKQLEHNRAANDTHIAGRCPEKVHRLFKRSTCWVPKQRVFLRWIGSNGEYLPCHNQTPPQMCAQVPFMRMTSMNHHVDLVQAVFKKRLIRIQLKRVLHDARCSGNHAIFRYDGVTFNTARVFGLITHRSSNDSELPHCQRSH